MVGLAQGHLNYTVLYEYMASKKDIEMHTDSFDLDLNKCFRSRHPLKTDQVFITRLKTS